MKAKRLRYSAAALNDLTEIRRGLTEAASVRVSSSVTRKIRRRIERTKATPFGGAALPEYSANCRFVPCDPYVIYYSYDGAELYVLRIIHKARDRDTIMGGS